MSGWFFLHGSYLVAKNWNYRPVQLKQARFIGQAVCSPGVRADQQAQELPCSILASLFYIPCSLIWVVTGAYANRALFLRPIREGDANTVYTQNLSGKGACWARCPTGSLHSGQCFLFYFFFFFTVHGVCGHLVVTSSTHHFISVSPNSNCLTLAKRLFFWEPVMLCLAL